MFNSRKRPVVDLIISIALIFSISVLSISRIDTALAQNSTVKDGGASQTTGEISYLMIDADSKQVLLNANENMKIAPASTTKLLTGLVAMFLGLKENDVVQVGNEVVMKDSGLHLQPGDKITVGNLLKAMYLMSANDAAAALAVKAGGSMDAFIQSMNNYAQALGCTDSHFVNPHGLDNPEHYSTAKDMVKIGLAFLTQANLKKYTGMTQGTITWQRASGQVVSVWASNTNLLLGRYPGDQGLKTGTTTNAGECLITYAVRPDGNVLLALFGSNRRFSDTTAILDRGYAELRVLKALQNTSVSPDNLFQSTGLF